MSGKIVVGAIAGAYGVKGWVKVKSYTDPVSNILEYSPWSLGEGVDARIVKVVDGRLQGKVLVARLDGIDDRDQAEALTRSIIRVDRSNFADLEEGEYYWNDLVGLRVFNLEGVAMGAVTGLMSTGANDVLVVLGDRERLIPFVRGQYVKDISLERGEVRVDWDPEF